MNNEHYSNDRKLHIKKQYQENQHLTFSAYFKEILSVLINKYGFKQIELEFEYTEYEGYVIGYSPAILDENEQIKE